MAQRANKIQSRRSSVRRPRYQSSLRNRRSTIAPSRSQRRVSTRRQVFDRSPSQSFQGKGVVRKKIQAKVIDFPFTVGSDFDVRSDTLTADQGQMVLSDGETMIRITATGDRCDQSQTGVRNCMHELANKEQSQLKRYHSALFLETNKEKLWGKKDIINPYQLRKSNSGRYILMSTQDQYFGRFFFFEPSKEFVWKVEVDAPKKANSFLKDEEGIDRLLLSFFLKDADATRTKLQNKKSQALSGERNVTKGRVIRGGRVVIRADEQSKHEAAAIPFTLQLPEGLVLVSDTLDWDEGAMSFMDEGMTKVVIRATADVCASQTPRIVRRCLEDAANLLIRRGGENFDARNLLQKRNLQLALSHAKGNLARKSSMKGELGRFHLYRTEGKRFGQLVFRVPGRHHIWVITMEAPEKNDALLSDIRKIQKTFSSLLFSE